MTRRQATAREKAPLVYPESDGKPMAESDAHQEEMTSYVIPVLRDHFAGDPKVYVAGNNFLYYVQGNPKRCVSPDAYVVFGVEKGLRKTFKVWEEGGAVPGFVLEITSQSTKHEDRKKKLAIYRDELGVLEYFLFDLEGDWLPDVAQSRLLGQRLVLPENPAAPREYRPIPPDERGRVASRVLGLELKVEGGHLRFFVPGAREPLPTRAEGTEQERREKQQALARETRERKDKEQALAREDRERREKLQAQETLRERDAEIERLRAELERLQRG